MNWYKIAKKLIISKECKDGDCYPVSGRYMMDHRFSNPNLLLVHGIVTGQGKISGIQYDHSWIEDGDMVIDKSCGRNLILPKAVYYALGNIKNIKTYNPEQFSNMINKYQHWGPWEL